MKSKIIVRNRNHLLQLLHDEIELHGNQCDLNHLDVSNITDMNRLFFFSPEFNGNISKWDVSNVKSMDCIFEKSKFAGDISQWKPYSLKIQFSNFRDSIVNLPYWAKYKPGQEYEKNLAITDMHLGKVIKEEMKMNGNECNLNHLNVSDIKDMSYLFRNTKFNGDISEWDVSKVKDMTFMFSGSDFKGDLSKWTPYSLEHSINIFQDCSATLPYWANCKNNEEILIAINAYHLDQELNKNNNSLKKKMKI